MSQNVKSPPNPAPIPTPFSFAQCGHESKQREAEKQLSAQLFQKLSVTNFGVTSLLVFLICLLHGLWFSLTQIIASNPKSPLLREQKFNSEVIGVERHWYTATLTYADFFLIFFCFNVSLAVLFGTFAYGLWCWTQRMYGGVLATLPSTRIQARIIHVVGAALTVFVTVLLYIVRSQYSVVADLDAGYSDTDTANLAFGWCSLYLQMHLMYQYLVTSFLIRLDKAGKTTKFQVQPKLACTVLATILHMLCWLMNYWEYYHYGSLDWMAYFWCWLWYACWNVQEFWKDSFPIVYWRKDPYSGWPLITLSNPEEEVDLDKVDSRTAAAANPFGFMHQFSSEPLFPSGQPTSTNTTTTTTSTTTTASSSSNSGSAQEPKKKR